MLDCGVVLPAFQLKGLAYETRDPIEVSLQINVVDVPSIQGFAYALYWDINFVVHRRSQAFKPWQG